MNITNTGFYHEYWAKHQPEISNQPTGGVRWRVNDTQMSVDERFGDRWETQANGLVLVNIPEHPRALRAAELYLELWGGHPHTGPKTVTVNGKGRYDIPDNGTIGGDCTYTYPVIALEPQHLVNGMNAFQFSCERGTSFWGHYLIDQIAVRCYAADDDRQTMQNGHAAFHPVIQAEQQAESMIVSLTGAEVDAAGIAQVDFFACYADFDDTGSRHTRNWHGFTQAQQPVNHIGTSTQSPFVIAWDTRMIPDQTDPVKLRAIVRYQDGLNYATGDVTVPALGARHAHVELVCCDEAPVPFWSRANQVKEAIFSLKRPADRIERALLLVKVWDGGAGTIENPFTLNGHPYTIIAGDAPHDVVFTVAQIDPAHLREGDNVLRLLSDTEHHGIEILAPGPCLKIRYRA